ncbi:hypothetical protein PMAYCL1PPCAC_06877, partial [Pristionchus mayeri]
IIFPPMLLLLLFLPSSTSILSQRRDLIYPIRPTCFNLVFCREVSSDNLCDLECSSAECGLDGGDCGSINESDGKLMLALHISPPDFMFISHRFLSEISSITGSRVEIVRDSLDLLIWEWTPQKGPNRRLYLEREPNPPDISSIQVMLSLKRMDCWKDCMKKLDESMRQWYQSMRDESVSPFMLSLLYGKREESGWTLPLPFLFLPILAVSLLLLALICFFHGRKSSKEGSIDEEQSARVVNEVNRVERGQDSPLHALVSSTNQSIEEDIKALIKCGESINTVDRDGRSLLHLSIMHRPVSFLRWLLSMGADPSIVDDKHQSLLHLAVSSSSIETLSTLLEFPTVLRMIDHCDYRNMSALKLSMSYESTDFSRLLIDCGADINLRGMDGDDPLLCHRSPFHLAVMNNHREQIELLLERGADANSVDDRGRSPLHYAVQYCGMEIVEMMMRGGKCNVMGRDKEKKRAEDLARSRGVIEMANLLKGVSEGELTDENRPYLKNLRLHKWKEVTVKEDDTMGSSSHHTYVQPIRPLALSVHSSATDEGIYSDYQYPHFVPRCHSTQALYYL